MSFGLRRAMQKAPKSGRHSVRFRRESAKAQRRLQPGLLAHSAAIYTFERTVML